MKSSVALQINKAKIEHIIQISVLDKSILHGYNIHGRWIYLFAKKGSETNVK